MVGRFWAHRNLGYQSRCRVLRYAVGGYSPGHRLGNLPWLVDSRRSPSPYRPFERPSTSGSRILSRQQCLLTQCSGQDARSLWGVQAELSGECPHGVLATSSCNRASDMSRCNCSRVLAHRRTTASCACFRLTRHRSRVFLRLWYSVFAG